MNKVLVITTSALSYLAMFPSALYIYASMIVTVICVFCIPTKKFDVLFLEFDCPIDSYTFSVVEGPAVVCIKIVQWQSHLKISHQLSGSISRA